MIDLIRFVWRDWLNFHIKVTFKEVNAEIIVYRVISEWHIIRSPIRKHDMNQYMTEPLIFSYFIWTEI